MILTIENPLMKLLFYRCNLLFCVPSLIAIVILLNIIEGITIEIHSVYASVADFNFGAVGDWGCDPNAEKTVKNIQDKDPELVLALGDFSYENSADCWFNIISPIKNKTTIVIGNHDDDNATVLNQYMNHFGLTKQYYSFDYQNIHFTAMSTELPYGSRSEQYKFVNNDLAKAASDPNIDWIIVYYHSPAYVSPNDCD